MKTMKKHGMALALLLAMACTGHAQPAQDAGNYPARPVTLIVPTAAAGGTDTIARVFAEGLTRLLRQPFVVDNRPGANGLVGVEQAARSAPDGYRLLFTYTASMAVNPSLYRKVPYDPVKDFTPIAQIGRAGNLLLVSRDLPVHSLKEFVEHVRARPGQLSYCSWGQGSGGHLTMEFLLKQAGLQMQHVPYKGSSPALTDLMGGQIQLMFDSMPSAMPFIASGRLRALAVTSASRSSSLPDVPTMEEAGMPGFRTSTWYGLWAPKNTPQDVVQKLWTESRRVLAEPQIAAQYRRLGAEPVGSTPAEFARYIQAEARKWEEIVKASGARAD